jgi:hypothetical protein
MSTLMVLLSLALPMNNFVNIKSPIKENKITNKGWFEPSKHDKNKPSSDYDINIENEFITPTPTVPNLPRVLLTKSGFNLQPNSTPIYVTEGKKPVTIRTQVVRAFMVQRSPIFEWKQLSSNDTSWHQVDNGNVKITNSSTKPYYDESDLSFTPSRAGTYYFQNTATITTRMIHSNIYIASQIATVIVEQKEKHAKDLTIKPDDSNLFVNDDFTDEESTQANATTTTEKATDLNDIVWSTTCPYIDIDANSGKITLNKKKYTSEINDYVPHIAEIKATITHPDGSKVIGIGQVILQYSMSGPTTAISNQKTMFTLNNIMDEKDYSINWYVNKKRQENQSGKTFSYSPTYSNTNNIKTIYAEIRSKDSQHQKEKYMSNSIKLQIIPDEPAFSISHTITNNTFKKFNDNIERLKQIAVGDELVHKIVINHNFPSLNTNPVSGTLRIPLTPGEEYNCIKEINNTHSVNHDKITIHKSDTSNEISIPIVMFPNEKSIILTIQTKIVEIIDNKFIYEPKYVLDSSDTYYPAKNFTVEFTNNAITMNPNTIDFGIIPKIKGFTKSRISPDDKTDILSINDSRREKHHTILKLQYTQFFPLENKFTRASLDFKYYDKNNIEKPFSNHSIDIKKTTEGESLKPIIWDKDEGLRIHMFNSHMMSGKFRSVLTWYVTDSVTS